MPALAQTLSTMPEILLTTLFLMLNVHLQADVLFPPHLTATLASDNGNINLVDLSERRQERQERHATYRSREPRGGRDRAEVARRGSKAGRWRLFGDRAPLGDATR
jgi:hypothetical protein